MARRSPLACFLALGAVLDTVTVVVDVAGVVEPAKGRLDLPLGQRAHASDRSTGCRTSMHGGVRVL